MGKRASADGIHGHPPRKAASRHPSPPPRTTSPPGARPQGPTGHEWFTTSLQQVADKLHRARCIVLPEERGLADGYILSRHEASDALRHIADVADLLDAAKRCCPSHVNPTLREGETRAAIARRTLHLACNGSDTPAQQAAGNLTALTEAVNLAFVRARPTLPHDQGSSSRARKTARPSDGRGPRRHATGSNTAPVGAPAPW